MKHLIILSLLLFSISGCTSDKLDDAETVPAADARRSAGPSMPLLRWPDLTNRPLPAPDHVISLGPKTSDVVDLWLPSSAGPHPVILMVHGGCWQKAIADRALMNYAAAALREEGFAVWNIEYRGVDEPGGGFPGTYDDAARNADALARYAADYNLDLSRFAAFGHSAGGHLALWLAGRTQLPATSALYDPQPIKIPAVLSTGGLPDLEAAMPVTLESCLSTIFDKLTGPTGPDRLDPLADTSVARLLPMSAYQVSLNATNDTIAPPSLGKDYTRKARAAGDRARFIEVSGGHVELIAPGTKAFDKTIEILKDLTNRDQSPPSSRS